MKRELAKVIKISTTHVLEILEVPDLSIETVSGIIGGYVENVKPRRLPRDMAMIVDEEGLIKELPINLAGSYLYETDKHGSPIVGDILIMGDRQEEYSWNWCGLSEEQIQEILVLLEFIVKV